MSKQCIKPRKKRDAEWFKDKVLLVQAQANGQVLQEEELAFLADPGLLNTSTDGETFVVEGSSLLIGSLTRETWSTASPRSSTDSESSCSLRTG
nr:hypothetical protein [Tanacetum cinerariifolium]